MFVDDVSKTLAASLAGGQALPLDEGLLLPVTGTGRLRGTFLRQCGAPQAPKAAELLAGFLGLLPKAGILAFENLPTREGGDGSLLLHALTPGELSRARAFWEGRGQGAIWMESRIGPMQRGWLAVSGPGRLRIFEAHLHDDADALSILPYATDTIWEQEGRTVRGAYDPLGIMDAYAKAEAFALGGSTMVTQETWNALTREADLVLMASTGLGFPGTRIEDVRSRPGQVGIWRKVVRLGRDAEIDAARIEAGLPRWDESPIAGLH